MVACRWQAFSHVSGGAVVLFVILSSSWSQMTDGIILTHATLPDGFKCYYEYPEAAGSCYVINRTAALSWPDAFGSCLDQGGSLMAKPTATRTVVVNEIMRQENVTEVWLGMNKILIPWTWTGGRSTDAPLSDLWAAGQPAESSRDDDCVAIDVQLRYKMTALPCHTTAGYVCQADQNTSLCQHAAVYVTEIIYHNSSCFIFVDGSRDPKANITWFEVDYACAELSYAFDGRSVERSRLARPAIVDSEELYEKIERASPGMSLDIKRYWIGLTRARWIGASGLVVDHFFIGGPQVINCVSMVTSTGLVPIYKSHLCENSFSYICEFDLTKVAEENVSTTGGTSSGNLTTVVYDGFNLTQSASPNLTKTSTSQSGVGVTESRKTSPLETVEVNVSQSPDWRVVGWTTPLADGSNTNTDRVTDDVTTVGDGRTVTRRPSPLTTETQTAARRSTNPAPYRPETSPIVSPLPATSSTVLGGTTTPCARPIGIALKIYVAAAVADVSRTRTVNLILNNMTQDIDSASACFDVTVTPIGDSLNGFDDVDQPTSGPAVYMVFSFCDRDSLVGLPEIRKTAASFWILVCFGMTADRHQVGVRPVLERFDYVMLADDGDQLDDVTREVTNRLLAQSSDQLLTPATPSDKAETTNRDPEEVLVTSTNTRFLAIVIGVPCAAVLLIVVVLTVIVIKRKAALRSDEAGNYLGLDESYDKVSRDSIGSQTSGPNDRPSTSEPEPEPERFFYKDDTSTQISPFRSASDEGSAETDGPPGGADKPAPDDVTSGSTASADRWRRRPTAGARKFVRFAKSSIGVGRKAGVGSVGLIRNCSDSTPTIRRSKRGVVKLNAPRCGATIYTENTPNTLFYNCWTVPAVRKA